MNPIAKGHAVKYLVAAFFLTISIWYLWAKFDWKDITHNLTSARYIYFLFWCGLLYLAYLGIRTLRWLVLIRDGKGTIRFTNLYLPTAIFVSLSLFTPGQFGEAFKAEVLRRRGHVKLAAALQSFVIERLLDITAVVALAFGSLIKVTRLAPYSGSINLIIGLIFVGCLILLAAAAKKPESRMGRLLSQTIAMAKTPSILATASLLTLASWLLVILAWQLTLASIGVYVSFLETTAVMTLTTLSSIISFIPGGAGVSEMVISELLQTLGIGTARAQAGAIILRMMGLWWLCIGALHLLYWFLRRPAQLAKEST